MLEQINQFKVEAGIQLEIKDGKPYYGGAIRLQNSDITILPDNLTVEDSVNITGCKNIHSLPEGLTARLLLIEGTDITTLPKNLTVGDVNLCLGLENDITTICDNITIGTGLMLGDKITSIGKNLTVGGILIIDGAKITALPENLCVCGPLVLRNLDIKVLPKTLKLGSSLIIYNCPKLTSLPDGLVIRSFLSLEQQTSMTTLPKKLKVCGLLNLEGCTGITSIPTDLVAGGLRIAGGTSVISIPNNIKIGHYYMTNNPGIEDIYKTTGIEYDVRVEYPWICGKYFYFGYIGGITFPVFGECLWYNANVWKVKKLLSLHPSYVVTDGNGKFAVGNTIEEAYDNLKYRETNDTSVCFEKMKEYQNYTLDTILTFDEAIECYVVITGIRLYDDMTVIKHWAKNMTDKKGNYPIRKIIELTHELPKHDKFKKFFNSSNKQYVLCPLCSYNQRRGYNDFTRLDYYNATKMKLYLDIDGVLLTYKNIQAAEGVADFVSYITAHFDCYWLTTHCKGDASTAIDYLSEYLPQETMEKLKNVKPTTWDTLKTEGIDFDSDFIWVDDYVMNAEKSVLKERGKEESLIMVDLGKEDALLEIVSIIAERTLHL